MQITFITANQHKVDYLTKWLGRPIEHQKLELDELQSLDAHYVIEHKVRQAYAILRRPVLVEDVSLTFTAMGRLPGTLIKWFLEELHVDGLCALAHSLEHQKAEASIIYALFDGNEIQYFAATQAGSVAPAPRGNMGFGWNAVFVPEGSDKTYAEMTDEELTPFSFRAQAVERLKHSLLSL